MVLLQANASGVYTLRSEGGEGLAVCRGMDEAWTCVEGCPWMFQGWMEKEMGQRPGLRTDFHHLHL